MRNLPVFSLFFLACDLENSATAPNDTHATSTSIVDGAPTLESESTSLTQATIPLDFVANPLTPDQDPNPGRPSHELHAEVLPASLSGVDGAAPGLLLPGESHVVSRGEDGVLLARVELDGTLWIEHHDRDETGEPMGVASMRQTLGQAETGFQLAWIGDIDKDGALDLIVEGPPVAGARPERRLWTSRLAAPGELRGLRFARILPRAQG